MTSEFSKIARAYQSYSNFDHKADNAKDDGEKNTIPLCDNEEAALYLIEDFSSYINIRDAFGRTLLYNA